MNNIHKRIAIPLSFSLALFLLFLSRFLPAFLPLTGILTLVLFLVIVFRGMIRKEGEFSFYHHTSLCFVIIGGFMLRWMGFLSKIGRVLDPDAEGFYYLALNSKTVFTATMNNPPFVREPFFIWLTKFFFLFVPDTRTSLRTMTLLLSVAVLVVLYYFCRLFYRKFFNTETASNLALFTTILATINPQLIFMSSRGLRFECYLALFLLFLFVVFRKKELQVHDILFAGILGGVLCLLRVSTPSWLLPVSIVLALKYRWQWWKPVGIICISFIILLPHFISNYVHAPDNDPFYTANIHARFYRNFEFKDHEGFPTSEEISENAWTGEPITFFDYLFTLHSPAALVTRFFVGMKRIFLTSYVQMILFNARILVIAYLAGLLYLVFRGQWLIPTIMFLVVAPVGYLAGLGLDWRLLGPLIPFYFISLTAALPLIFHLYTLLRRIRHE